jgi:hypothetical protein
VFDNIDMSERCYLNHIVWGSLHNNRPYCADEALFLGIMKTSIHRDFLFKREN